MARTSKTSTSTATTQTNTDARIGAAEGAVVVDDGGSFSSVVTTVDSETGKIAVAEGGKTSRKALDLAGAVTGDALKSNNYALEEAFAFGSEVVSSLNETARNALDGVTGAASEVIAVSRSEQNQALETVARAVMVIGVAFAAFYILRGR